MNNWQSFSEWLFEKYGMEGDPNDMYEVDPDAYNELEDEWNEDMRKREEVR